MVGTRGAEPPRRRASARRAPLPKAALSIWRAAPDHQSAGYAEPAFQGRAGCPSWGARRARASGQRAPS